MSDEPIHILFDETSNIHPLPYNDNTYSRFVKINLLPQNVAIGKRLKLSPAFPLLHTERASFQAFRVPSGDGFDYKFQVTLVELALWHHSFVK